MKNMIHLLLITILCFALLFTGCAKKDDESSTTTSSSSSSSSSSSGTKGVKLTASLAGASTSRIITGRGRRTTYATSSDTRCLDSTQESTSSCSISPSSYKMTLADFVLIKDDESTVSLLNPDNSTYSLSSPLSADFSSGDNQTLISLDNLSAGTYTGYKMLFLYMDMPLPVKFHLPSVSTSSDWETDVDNVSQYLSSNTDPTEAVTSSNTRKFRMYYNANGKYWKRDFVVQLDNSTNSWYWLRREVDNSSGTRNFFIAVDNNTHPSGGSGPNNTLDLFEDGSFWGTTDMSDEEKLAHYADNSTSTEVWVKTDGTDTILSESFSIPSSLDKLYTINLKIDISGTMMYDEGGFVTDYATDVSGVLDNTSSTSAGVLDLGPSYSSKVYGDAGLHPRVPTFTVTVSSE